MPKKKSSKAKVEGKAKAPADMAPQWVRAFFTDGRIFKVPVHAIREIMIKKGLSEETLARPEMVISAASALSWEELRLCATEVLRDTMSDLSAEWPVAKKSIEY